MTVNVLDWLSEMPQFFILIPTVLSCYYPVKNHMRYSLPKTAALCACVIIPFAVLGSLATSALKIDANIILVPFIIISFFLYRLTLTADFPRALAVYVGVCAAQSFPAQLAIAFDARLHPSSGAADFSTEAQLFQLGLSCLMALLAFYPSCKYASKMLDRLDSAKIWYSVSALSFIFFLFNILAAPHSYENVLVGRMYYLFPLFEFLMMTVLIIIYVFFYHGAIVLLERTELEKRSQLLEMQSHQYRELQEYMKQSQRLRHDFRQSVHILSALAEKNDIDGVRAHLSEYEQRLNKSVSPSYCANTALNALFGHYHELAEADGIRTEWKIELPEPLTFSELDMAALFGNIMENAIQACIGLPEDKRYFNLTTEIRHGNSLYVVSTNSFDGNALKSGDGAYRSTKHGGQGTGLASIAAVAEKYGGSTRVYNSGTEFFVDVVLKI